MSSLRWESSPGRARRRLFPARFVVGGVVVALALAYLVVTGLRTGTAYYLTVSELQAQEQGAGGQAGLAGRAGAPVRVSGDVVAGSVVREGSTVRFAIADSGGSLPVVYRGVVPDIFGEGIQVVVEGRPEAGGAFAAQTLLAKCPSKFEAVLPVAAA